MSKERTPNLARIKESVVAEIKWLSKRGDPLNISAVKRSHPKLLEVVFGVRPFWGWKQAIEDACLDYAKIRVELAETVECRECGKRHLRLQHHLGSAHNLTSDDYLRRYPSAAINADQWQARTYPLTTGLPDFPHWEPVWTPEYVLDRLHHMHVRGMRVHSSAIQKSEPALLPVAIRYFGSWDAALELAGIPVEDTRLRQSTAPRDAEALIAFLKERAGAGKEMNYKAMQTDHPGVLCAIRAVFGDYASALKAGGFDLSTVRRRGRASGAYPTKETVLDAIRGRHAIGKKLNAAAVLRDPDGDAALHSRATRIFGSWGKALLGAGLDPQEVSVWKHRSPDAVLEAIRRRAQAGIPYGTKFLLKGEHADSGLYGGALRFFGGWVKALQAAGITYRPPRRRAAYQTRNDVLASIRKRHADGLPLVGGSMREGEHADWSLYGAGERLFGNWADAVHAALPGLPLLRRRRRKGSVEPNAVPVALTDAPKESGIPAEAKPLPLQAPKQFGVPPVAEPSQPLPPLLPRRWREELVEPKVVQAHKKIHAPKHLRIPPLAKPPPPQVVKQPGIPLAVKPPPPPGNKPGDAPTTMEDLIRNMGLGD